MADHIPEPVHTPEGPTYEGRRLARPTEEVVDQGAGFDVKTLVSRRSVLGLIGLGVGASVLAACGGATTTSATSTAASTSAATGEIPDETAGPYPGDGSNGPDVLEEAGIVRSDIRSSIGADAPVDGVPLSFTFTVTDLANDDVPFENVAVYAWHCDAQGRYSMYSEGVENESWLRGVQVADADGRVTFKSIVPACYSGRWPHIHFEVYPDVDSITDSANAISTSQMALPEDVLGDIYALSAYEGSVENLAQVSLANDNVFGDDDGALQMATISGDTDSGYVASLAVRVDTSTAASAGAPPSAGGGPAGGGPAGS
ncbi:intradiol ring-cleavage dioxygenase [Solirubrobacter taibaiensis]|nr:intradiol ring-cleavage dioxygenase [Solirubrobacter taibaiensis]